MTSHEFPPSRTGAAEAVLERSRGGEHSPYEWLLRSVSRNVTNVLDVACGSGVLSRRLQEQGHRVVGLDPDAENLRRAEELGEGEWVQSDVDHFPFEDESFDAVVTVLGLGLSANRHEMLKEVARVLRPGGVFAALMPSLRPLNPGDMALVSRLAAFLRVAPQVPGPTEFRARKSLEAVGLTKMEDARGRFYFRVASAEDAETLIAGLRPAPDRARAQGAVDFLTQRILSKGFDVPLPMRRIVAIK